MSWMTETREDKVNAFRKAADKKNFKDAPEEAEMIMDCIFEEFMEFNDAAFEYETAIDNGAAWADPDTLSRLRGNLCKEWADLQYVVSQAALFYDIPADASFNRVHNSNMTKVVDGKVIFRADGKILKPETYVAPDMSGL